MRRYDLGDGIVEIKHSDGSDRWLVVKKVLDASKISLQVQLYRQRHSHTIYEPWHVISNNVAF